LIYVGEKACDSLRKAAALSGVPESTLYKRLRYGEYFHNGVRISDAPPHRAIDEEAPVRKLLAPLLRRPFGEGLLDQGLPEGWR